MWTGAVGWAARGAGGAAEGLGTRPPGYLFGGEQGRGRARAKKIAGGEPGKGHPDP